MKRSRLFLELALAVFILAVYLILFHIRVLEYRGQTYRCGICGISGSHGARYLFGTPYSTYEDFPPAGETTKEYRELVGLSHQHEWLLVAHTVSRNSILGGGRTRHSDRHPLRIRLVRDALLAIEDEFMSCPIEFRRNLYFRLINSTSHDELHSIVEEARSTADAAKPGQSSEGQAEQEESEKGQQPAMGIEVR
jgi:hypothetical protein